jgi:poly(3-hydroxybutyrate) depolymerase
VVHQNVLRLNKLKRQMGSKLFITLAVLGTLMFSVAGAQQTAKITSSNIAYLEYLPQGYNTNTNLYPVVISLHGIKERGTTSTDPTYLLSSVQRVANVGLPKYVKYGAQYPFILISPQLKSSFGTWPASYVKSVIDYVRTKLRIDPKRIYITGLSLGGYGVWTTLGAYPDLFAAAVPICSGGSALSKACAISSQNVAVWGFHGEDDGIVSYTVTTKMINAMNACSTKPNPLAKATIFPGLGHIIWDKVYNNTTALDWMLTFRNGTTPTSGTSTTNTAPTVSAGSDKTITLPTNYLYLQGTASDSDGIASYTWTKVSGSTASLSGQTTSKVKAYNLVAGTYVFRLTVKDTKGLAKYDDVTVKVLSSTSSTNAAPVANAGADRSITSPTSSIKLYGSAQDSDGTIASYKWTQSSGPTTAYISYYRYPTASITNLKPGKYYFKLTVQDNDGAVDYDIVVVTVYSGTASVINLESSFDSMLASAD